MLILAIETSTPHSSVALMGPDGAVATASLGVPQRHGEFLAPALQFCLEQAGRTVEDVTGVAVGLGPGLYTGLRVGIATAASFASARGLPTVGLSGLDVLAFEERHTRRLVCSAIDARRGEVFWAFYRPSPGGVQRESGPEVGDIEALAADIDRTGEEVLIIGNGVSRDDLPSDAHVTEVVRAWPDAQHLAALALPRFEREETVRPAELRPIYLRQADAKIGWAQRGRMRGGTGS